MPEHDLTTAYHHYIACLNARDLDRLGRFVAEDVDHNGRRVGLAGYRAMLERDYREIPDLRFDIQFLVVDEAAATVGARLNFDCTPVGRFLGLAIDGRRVAFSENVFYEYVEGKIRRVWSVIDKAGVEAQL